MKTFLFWLFPGLIIFGINCTPDKDFPTDTKSIKSVVFKTADNPSLSGEVTGIITGDTVKLVFPGNTDLSNLIPSIDHDGLSIQPATNIAQNFTVPVQYRLTAENGSSRNYILSGRTASFSDSLESIQGLWKVVKDSVVNNNFFQTCGGSSDYPQPGVYIGRPEDYWVFKPGNLLDVRENNTILTDIAGQMVPGHINWNESPCWRFSARIIEINSTKLTFTHSRTSSSGGYYARTVFLKR